MLFYLLVTIVMIQLIANELTLNSSVSKGSVVPSTPPIIGMLGVRGVKRFRRKTTNTMTTHTV
jgi:hypothetical protein